MASESKQNEVLDKDTQAFLARIRKTIADSELLMDQAQLRLDETDRMLESQGLTREQLAAMRFSPGQIDQVNQELRRRSLPTLEPFDHAAQTEGREADDPRLSGRGRAAEPTPEAGDSQENLENRRRKFNVMMNHYRL